MNIGLNVALDIMQ